MKIIIFELAIKHGYLFTIPLSLIEKKNVDLNDPYLEKRKRKQVPLWTGGNLLFISVCLDPLMCNELSPDGYLYLYN